MLKTRVIPWRSRALIAATLIGLTLCTTSSARAQVENADVDTVTQLNRRALEKFKTSDYEEARKLLKQALDLCTSAELDKHPIRARTHIHMGVVILTGFNQRELALKQFRKALEIQSDIRVTKVLSSPEVEAAFSEAALLKDGGETSATETPPPAEADTPAAPPPPAVTPRRAPPRQAAARKPPKKVKPSDEEEDDEGEEEEEESARPSHTVFIAAGIGTGFGLVSGKTDTEPKVEAERGAALASIFHILPELGFYIGRDMILSAVGRIQYTGPQTDTTQFLDQGGITAVSAGRQWAASGMLRFTTLFGGPVFRPFFSFGVGGGLIAHRFVYDYTSPDGTLTMKNRMDNIMSGVLLVGPGAGFWINAGDNFHFIFGVQTELAAPNFSFNVDVNAGLGVSF